ncbi:olfactory receptor 56-like [Hippopotamus amphibius kiboko]|uniref:olfactory receptor 56-like n=1 Tax=Hippopotamus amphibius kiboko TaxID=575201 RepID=UPI002592F415|nr:olfactory receptor 56-like [Hippopotamus amphibius kiboko]
MEVEGLKTEAILAFGKSVGSASRYLIGTEETVIKPVNQDIQQGNESSTTDFILLGLFSDSSHPGLLITIFLLILGVAITGNSVLALLIWSDAHLHTPMYFLLTQLMLMDLTLISTAFPKMVIDFFSGHSFISHIGCGVQIFLYLMLGVAECVLLTLTAFDRYLAICNPLRYSVIMTPRVCLQMATGSWAGGVLVSLMHTIYAMNFSTCDSRKIHHFFCEVMALLKLSCEDTSTYEKVVLASGIVFLLIPFGLIFTSYTLIFLTVFHMNSPKGRKKALATCSSHLTVVSLYFGPAMIIYMTPGSSLLPDVDQHLCVFDVLITPMLNPLIYSLRNKEVLEALRKCLWRKLMFIVKR